MNCVRGKKDDERRKKAEEKRRKNQYILLVDPSDVILNKEDKHNDTIEWSYM